MKFRRIPAGKGLFGAEALSGESNSLYGENVSINTNIFTNTNDIIITNDYVTTICQIVF